MVNYLFLASRYGNIDPNYAARGLGTFKGTKRPEVETITSGFA
jgi:hypothetical protein